MISSIEPSPETRFFLPSTERKAAQRMAYTEVEDLGEATHEELLEGARRSTQRLKQRAAELRAQHYSKNI